MYVRRGAEVDKCRSIGNWNKAEGRLDSEEHMALAASTLPSALQLPLLPGRKMYMAMKRGFLFISYGVVVSLDLLVHVCCVRFSLFCTR